MTSTGGATRDLRGRAFRQLIGGELVGGATTQPVIDPATEEVIATAPVAGADQVDAAVAAAAGAFEAWRAIPLAERAAVVRAIADAIEARREEIATIVTLENGKPIDGARGDVDDSLTWARHVADFVIEPEVLRDDEAARIEVHHRPVGVVAAIIPWNFPFFQTIYKLAPALLAGNTVVIKPAPTTPLNACLIAEIVQPLVPPGVVNVVGDAGEVGPRLTVHPDVAKVSFTGSTASGRKVMESGSPTLKKIVLELGGNDSAIVLADADVPAVAKDIFSWAFKNTGQVCINIKRIMVPGSLYEEFAEEFADLAKATKVGHGLDQDTELGPIQNSRQYEAVKTFLQKAHQDGTVIAGGSLIEGPGYFVQPTVVRDVAPESTLIHEEVFGPIRSLIRYEDVEEAIRQANDTHYGLGNSVWGTNVEEARLAHLDPVADDRDAEHNEAYLRFRAAVELGLTRTRRLEDYALELGYSARTLSRATQAAAGVNAKEFIDRRTTLEAKRMLAHSDRTAAQIAAHLGFTSATNFSKYFLRCAGTTPIAFRAGLRR